MPGRGLTVDEIMAILPETPRRIAAVTDGLKPAELRASPAPDAWSLNDVLAHLRACHDVLGGSILRIVAEDAPRWRRLSPRTWIGKTDYPKWEFAPALTAFTEQRTELLHVLEPLPPEAWDRFAMVTERDGVIEARTIGYYGDWLAEHERQHWAHIEEIVTAIGAEVIE
jgi:hypothetical protein